MSESRKTGRLVPVVIVLIVGTVVADMARRAFSASGRPASTALDAPPPSSRRSRNPASTTQPDRLRSTAQGGRIEPDAGNLAARREWVRLRIQDAGPRTYLRETLVETDSMLRRWPDDRISSPLRVAIMRQNVSGFREDFMGNVVWAVQRWNGVVPVGVVTTGDSIGADVVVTWATRLDSSRTGRTDLTWDRRGNIHGAVIVLATHTPEGQLLDSRRMSALALHEIGHALGLGHSRSREDVMFPIATAIELSDRDRRSAQLLYDLPPGSIR